MDFHFGLPKTSTRCECATYRHVTSETLEQCSTIGNIWILYICRKITVQHGSNFGPLLLHMTMADAFFFPY